MFSDTNIVKNSEENSAIPLLFILFPYLCSKIRNMQSTLPIHFAPLQDIQKHSTEMRTLLTSVV
ncbi:hypothetical protein JCM10512_799 [Bacteroides reticulotermitis JCM 10512]|uniref:Uncharacterized protein n=1 Tax=Bacteroides reticulotermitis JCM 10512 TaxID=1445607 RepID=W4UN46_9BACE|nr:hypothetical protein JCM10512_799 [Bacteroides reticulotermitis JCM 10512]